MTILAFNQTHCGQAGAFKAGFSVLSSDMRTGCWDWSTTRTTFPQETIVESWILNETLSVVTKIVLRNTYSSLHLSLNDFVLNHNLCVWTQPNRDVQTSVTEHWWFSSGQIWHPAAVIDQTEMNRDENLFIQHNYQQLTWELLIQVMTFKSTKVSASWVECFVEDLHPESWAVNSHPNCFFFSDSLLHPRPWGIAGLWRAEAVPCCLGTDCSYFWQLLLFVLRDELAL